MSAAGLGWDRAQPVRARPGHGAERGGAQQRYQSGWRDIADIAPGVPGGVLDPRPDGIPETADLLASPSQAVPPRAGA